jgi:Cu(I)/Ag(I) efflux system membrane fusion protein
VTLYAPLSGVVIEKHVQQGDYVETGAPVYTLADLDHLWVQLEAYESDMEWIHHGQEVEFVAEAYPGRAFLGRVSFIDPVLDPRTRTVKVRVNLRNEGRLLKPDMFVRAVVRTRVSGGGRVFDPYLAGKWVSPMHPWVVKEGPGACDVCGMDLVPAEELGFVPEASGLEAPLVIPATAPLITGKRAVVYVELPGAERPTYEGREVELGPRAGDLYVVRAGLAEGERVVVEGNFKIDSALQIQARPSMMNSGESAALGRSLGPFYRAMLELGAALAGDDAAEARRAFRSAEQALHGLETGSLAAGERDLWERRSAGLHAAVVAGGNAPGLEEARAAFRTLSEAATALARETGHELDEPVLVAFCPMVPGGGAEWLQGEGRLANPYFGASMLRCGEVRATLPPAAGGEAEEEP